MYTVKVSIPHLITSIIRFWYSNSGHSMNFLFFLVVGHSIRCRSTPYVYFYNATHSLSLFTRHLFWIHYTVVSIVAIICQKYNVLCENGGFSIHFAYAYLEFVDFVSITCAPSLLASPPFIRADLLHSREMQGCPLWSFYFLRPDTRGT